MAEQGTLRRKPNGNFEIASGGRSIRVQNAEQLSPALRASAESLDFAGAEVDYDYDKGVAKRVRPRGEGWAVAPSAPSWPKPVARRLERSFDEFLNPFTFAPCPPDGQVIEPWTGLDRARPGEWHPRIEIEIATVTPMIVSGPIAESRADGHKVFDTRIIDGRVTLAATGVKGALRSAYEVITNSRLGVFSGHDEPLSQRLGSDTAREMIPARVSDDGKSIELLIGTSRLGEVASSRSGAPTQYAAWLRRYLQPPANLPNVEHGERVTAQLQLMEHQRRFRFWQVVGVQRPGGQMVDVTPPASLTHTRLQTPPKTVHGWVYITNQNINGKHDERIFFVDGNARTVPLTDTLRTHWRGVIDGYVSAHTEAEVHQRKHEGKTVPAEKYLGREPGKTGWSAHIANKGPRELTPGTLLYAHHNGTSIDGLYPVQISRGLYRNSPASLLPKSLRPAPAVGELTSAERLFGWVPAGRDTDRESSDTASRSGRVRVHMLPGPTVDQLEHFDPPLTLAILGAPRPQQARFSTGRPTSSGTRPLAKGVSRRELFAESSALRPRKLYLHHAGLPPDYWKRTHSLLEPIGDRYQEYRRFPKTESKVRPDGTSVIFDAPSTATGEGPSDDQNRSIRSWVPPGNKLRAVLDVEGASAFELGALLWLLDLPHGAHHRLGYGKPLGFGSVRVTIDSNRSWIASSEQRMQRWRRLDSPVPEWSVNAAAELVQGFKDRLRGTGAFESVANISAFLTAASGVVGPAVHYPRARPSGLRTDVPVPPTPAYEWFVENERIQHGEVTHGESLPAPGEVLPIHRAGERRR